MSKDQTQLDKLLDKDNTDVIVLYDDNNNAFDFEQVALIPHEENLYSVLKPIKSLVGVGENECIVFRMDDSGDEVVLRVEQDSKVVTKVYNKYLELLAEEN